MFGRARKTHASPVGSGITILSSNTNTISSPRRTTNHHHHHASRSMKFRTVLLSLLVVSMLCSSYFFQIDGTKRPSSSTSAAAQAADSLVQAVMSSAVSLMQQSTTTTDSDDSEIDIDAEKDHTNTGNTEADTGDAKTSALPAADTAKAPEEIRTANTNSVVTVEAADNNKHTNTEISAVLPAVSAAKAALEVKQTVKEETAQQQQQQESDLLSLPTNIERLLQKLGNLRMVTADDDNNDNGDANGYHYDATVAASLAGPALAALKERETVYERKGRPRHFQVRGNGYLYNYHNITLAAQLPIEPKLHQTNRIRIYNVYDPTTSIQRNDCHLLTIWVRVMGPELFAGSARAVQPQDNQKTCYWEFPVDLRVSGDYRVDAKVLVWNGHVDRHIQNETQCTFSKNSTPSSDVESLYPRHASLQGFKFYAPGGSCCEICSRMRLDGCRYWATPGYRIPNANKVINGCELFFEETVSESVVPDSITIPILIKEYFERIRKYNESQAAAESKASAKILLQNQTTTATTMNRKNRQRQRRLLIDCSIPKEHGPPQNFPVSYYLGCSWSFWFSLEYPCDSGDLDDKVFMTTNTFTVGNTNTNENNNVPQQQQFAAVDPSLPLCSVPNLTLDDRGRWVRKAWPDSNVCPEPMVVDPAFDKYGRFPIMKHDPDHPHCWHRDDLRLAKTKCHEKNCRLIPDNSLWKGPLQAESEWYGVYRYDHCNLLEFTDKQLQQCFELRDITKIETRGASISEYLNEYRVQRLMNLTLPTTTTTTVRFGIGREVTVNTLMNPNIVWKQDEEMYLAKLREMPVAPNHTLSYIVTPFYWASERETHVHAAMAEKLTVAMELILAPKHYRIINGLELTKVWPYDTATQTDGLHIIGPPMKMIWTILFHDLCHDVVSGSLV